MVETSYASLQDADVVLFIIEATSTDIGKGDRIILEKIKEAKQKTSTSQRYENQFSTVVVFLHTYTTFYG